jgi:hypothetical protein
VVASAAALLAGCSSDTVLSSIGMPTSGTTLVDGRASAAPPGPPEQGGESNTVHVTARQRGFLDALTASGVKPSSELSALSIGSYVCQARAAKQTDQEVWDYVLPLVRSDVRSSKLSSMAPTTGDVNSATADYIRIATARLC